jgi:hypothetical protein
VLKLGKLVIPLPLWTLFSTNPALCSTQFFRYLYRGVIHESNILREQSGKVTFCNTDGESVAHNRPELSPLNSFSDSQYSDNLVLTVSVSLK